MGYTEPRTQGDRSQDESLARRSMARVPIPPASDADEPGRLDYPGPRSLGIRPGRVGCVEA